MLEKTIYVFTLIILSMAVINTIYFAVWGFKKILRLSDSKDYQDIVHQQRIDNHFKNG